MNLLNTHTETQKCENQENNINQVIHEIQIIKERIKKIENNNEKMFDLIQKNHDLIINMMDGAKNSTDDKIESIKKKYDDEFSIINQAIDDIVDALYPGDTKKL
jgi:hypothetical protein